MSEQLVDQLTNQLHADWLARALGALQNDGREPVDTGRELLHQSSLLHHRHISREARLQVPRTTATGNAASTRSVPVVAP